MQCKNDPRSVKINQYHTKCQQLTDILDHVLTHLSKLDEEYSSALNKTRSFYNSCDSLIQQQVCKPQKYLPLFAYLLFLFVYSMD